MSDLSQELEELIIAGRSASSPTRADFERVLGRIRGEVGGLAASDALSGAASNTARQGVKWLSGKTIAVAAASVAFLMGGMALWNSRRVAEPSDFDSGVQPQRSTSALPKMRAIVSGASTRELGTPAQAPEPAVTSQNSPRGPVPNASVREPLRGRDSLSEEVSILSRAETELHNGRAESALRALGEHERKFPNGILTEERIAAKVQALCALGRHAEANAQLTRLRPGSLHSEAARRACAASSAGRQSTAAGQPSVANKH